MKKIIALIIMLAMIIVAFPVISESISGDVASANPNKCPQGQICKWVQHRVTSKCQYLPVQSVAYPWDEITEGTCPQPTGIIVVENTKIIVIEGTNTVVVESTGTKVVKKPTNTAVPTIVIATVGKNNDKVTVPTVTPFSFMKNICDACIEEQRQANA